MLAVLGLQPSVRRESDFSHVVLGDTIASDLSSAIAVVVDVCQAYGAQDGFEFLK